MDQLVNVLFSIDKAHTVPQRTMDCGPGLGGLNQVTSPTDPLSLLRVSVASVTISLPDVQIVISLKS